MAAAGIGDHDCIARAWGLGVTMGVYVAAHTLGAFVTALPVRWNYTETIARFDPGHTIKSQVDFSTRPGTEASR